MTRSTTMTLRIDPQILADLDRLAANQRRTRSQMAHLIIEDRVKSEIQIMNDLQAGIDELDAGGGIPHEEAIVMIAQMRREIYGQ